MTKTTSPECQEMLANISAYLDGDLEAARCDAIERHCQVCAPCAGLVEGLKETVGLCRQAGAVPLPEPVRQRARDRLRRLLEPEEHRLENG
jgi:anti-sigma factor RsiW